MATSIAAQTDYLLQTVGTTYLGLDSTVSLEQRELQVSDALNNIENSEWSQPIITRAQQLAAGMQQVQMAALQIQGTGAKVTGTQTYVVDGGDFVVNAQIGQD